MSEPIPHGWHWRASCTLNGILGGRSDEPLCSRAWRLAWQTFIDAMQIMWRDPVHCEDVHIRWQAMQADPTGERPRAGY